MRAEQKIVCHIKNWYSPPENMQGVSCLYSLEPLLRLFLNARQAAYSSSSCNVTQKLKTQLLYSWKG